MPFFRSNNDKKINTDEPSENSPRILWQAIIGGAVCAGIGTWIYPDIGTVIGATIGIIGGAYLGDLLKISKINKEDDITFEVSKKAKAFFADLDKPSALDTKINLPPVEKKPEDTSLHEEEYNLQLFNQATTLRGTGVFPHKKGREKKNNDPDSES